MKVLCISWKGKFFKKGAIYTLDEFECVYNPISNHTTAAPWFMYKQLSACFVPATDLIIALN